MVFICYWNCKCDKILLSTSNLFLSAMAMARELSSFPLPPQHLHKLNKAGYVTVEDLKGVSPTQLSEGEKTKYCFKKNLCVY